VAATRLAIYAFTVLTGYTCARSAKRRNDSDRCTGAHAPTPRGEER
jgi:hypothetical protein